MEVKVPVCRKPTHTDRSLDFGSCHPMHQKRAAVNTLLKRARNIPSTVEGRRRSRIINEHYKPMWEGACG